MATAMDSGVDTGNDSNDSSVQEKLSKMDLEISPESKSSDSAVETNSEEEQDYGNQNPCPPKIGMIEPGVNMSITQVHPINQTLGFELPNSPPSESRGRNIKCVMFNMKDIGGVFVSGGPFGTEYKGNELVSKMHRRMSCMRHTAMRLKCLRSRSIQTNVIKYSDDYAKYRDMKRMCRAACTNNTDSMRQMLEAGLSPNCHDGYKRSPLHLAACLGYADMVKLLLDHGADPNAKDSIGNTPLHLAACTNHVDVITLLLKAGTRVSERDMAGHSPLQLAITKFNIMKRSIMPHPVLKEQVCQGIPVPGKTDLPAELLRQGWIKVWSKRLKRPYFWNKLVGVASWELPSKILPGNFKPKGIPVPGNLEKDSPAEFPQEEWIKLLSKRVNRPYFWNQLTAMTLWELPSNMFPGNCKPKVISMLTEYMKRTEGSAIDPDLLNKFESLVRVSDSSEEVESNIRDLLNNLSSLSLSGSS